MVSNEILASIPWIKTVAKTGSSTLPWIKHPNDVDYLFICGKVPSGREHNNFFRQKPDTECWLSRMMSSKFDHIWAYELPFMQVCYGTELPKWDIFEQQTEYKKILIDYGLDNPHSNIKMWYHVLTGIYMLDNGDYFLTEEQAENVNLCHDRQMTKEIYDYIQKRLKEYRRELDI